MIPQALVELLILTGKIEFERSRRLQQAIEDHCKKHPHEDPGGKFIEIPMQYGRNRLKGKR